MGKQVSGFTVESDPVENSFSQDIGQDRLANRVSNFAKYFFKQSGTHYHYNMARKDRI